MLAENKLEKKYKQTNKQTSKQTMSIRQPKDNKKIVWLN